VVTHPFPTSPVSFNIFGWKAPQYKVKYTKIKGEMTNDQRLKSNVYPARWRSGNAAVCKTAMRQFNSGTRLKLVDGLWTLDVGF
jgi:hypothetical protein